MTHSERFPIHCGTVLLSHCQQPFGYFYFLAGESDTTTSVICSLIWYISKYSDPNSMVLLTTRFNSFSATEYRFQQVSLRKYASLDSGTGKVVSRLGGSDPSVLKNATVIPATDNTRFVRSDPIAVVATRSRAGYERRKITC